MKKIFVIAVILFLLCGCNNNNVTKMIDVTDKSLNFVTDYAKTNDLVLKTEHIYHDKVEIDKIISQSIVENAILNKGDVLTVVISLGQDRTVLYQKYKVNELGNIPIMMYHNIVDKLSSETKYTGGNVDASGYSRTVEAFKDDLEFYYKSGYQMIRLSDYMNGIIDVELGKSPIILTFDDGNKNNMNVLGLNDKGELNIDSNCAVGILESFKKKYPDFSVTATFFLNSNLFGQSKYNDKILKWLVENNYDIGNHTKNHVDFTKIDVIKTQTEVAYMYKLLDDIIPNKYIHVIALPFGSPYKKTHENFSYIIEGESEGYKYQTESTLRVGWDADYSPFHKNFDKSFIKRVRAWDNNGKDFDIAYIFEKLEKNRYISDGQSDTIVIVDDTNMNINIKDKKIIKY